MCKHCNLTTPCGGHELCHACSIRVRADARRGLDAIEDYLGALSELECLLREQDG
jgi:hypothetical protein